MPTVAEYLKSQGIAEEVAAGLPADVAKALTGYMGSAESKLTEAATASAKAEEARRQAELERKEVGEYVDRYGSDLTRLTSLESTNKALVTYLNDQKAKGFTVPEELLALPEKKTEVTSKAPDNVAILADMNSQYLDAMQEYMRLFGTPLPSGDTYVSLASESARARVPIGAYMSEKYKFAGKREEVAKLAQEKEVEKRVTARLEEERRKQAEETGSNPNLRTGESSRHSFVPKIKRDDFHKSDGYQPERTRRQRLLERVHADVEANRQNANA